MSVTDPVYVVSPALPYLWVVYVHHNILHHSALSHLDVNSQHHLTSDNSDHDLCFHCVCAFCGTGQFCACVPPLSICCVVILTSRSPIVFSTFSLPLTLPLHMISVQIYLIPSLPLEQNTLTQVRPCVTCHAMNHFCALHLFFSVQILWWRSFSQLLCKHTESNNHFHP